MAAFRKYLALLLLEVKIGISVVCMEKQIFQYALDVKGGDALIEL